MPTVHESIVSTITTRTVARLAAPLVVANVSRTVMSICDVLFVGRLGTESVAAVGLAVVWLFLVRAFSFGLLSGVRIATARATGAGDPAMAAHSGWQSVWLSIAMGIAVLPAMVAASPVFHAMTESGEVARLATVYLTIRLAGAGFAFMMYGLTVSFQATGDTRTPMLANVLANGVNIALTPVLVFGWIGLPAWGVAGAAVATVLGTVVGSGLLLALWWRATAGHERGLNAQALRTIWRFGWPIGLSSTLDVGSYAVFSALLAYAGDAHLAAHVVVVRVVSVSFLPGLGVAEATGVLTGQAAGAGRPEAARQAVWAGLKLAMGVMTVCGLGFFAFPSAVLWPFGLEPEVLRIARSLVIIAACFQIFDAVVMVLYHALSGAGDTRVVTLASTLAVWFVQLPIGAFFVLVMDFGAPGAWVGMMAELVVTATVFAIRARSGRWLVSTAPSTQPAM